MRRIRLGICLLAAQALRVGAPELAEDLVALAELPAPAREERLAATLTTHRRAMGHAALLGDRGLVAAMGARVALLEDATALGASS